VDFELDTNIVVDYFNNRNHNITKFDVILDDCKHCWRQMNEVADDMSSYVILNIFSVILSRFLQQKRGVLERLAMISGLL